MIRLGSLAGYAFEGSRVLGGWTPPAAAGVFAIFYRPDPDREQFAVTFVGHADDLAAVGLPFRHPRAACWIARAGSKWNLHIATLDVPGGTRAHREQIVAELCATYDPSCNDEKYDNAWQGHWIQDYQAPNTTGPLTTPRET